jgi:hypothetical protein
MRTAGDRSDRQSVVLNHPCPAALKISLDARIARIPVRPGRSPLIGSFSPKPGGSFLDEVQDLF